ncbi:hypothetical protein [Dactylosporangium sp. NPDC051541]|uniref:hypothetical protein n=1 Tax=Dactylosporangium sp. NPDC051541 TaxID=3363977 RepID=UPI0037AD945F
MEPGHPPRQDRPTDNGQDQVNGSPPRPKSRRGWMSDSPLDGGSGWPTSAYAIVPRQPAAPKEEEPPAPPQEPPVEPPVDQEPEPPAQPSRKGRIGLLVIGLLVLIVAAVGGVLATRQNTANDQTDAAVASDPAQLVPDAGATTTTGPTADPSGTASGSAGGVGAGSGTVGSTAPSASAGSATSAAPGSSATTVPAAPPSTGILRAGTAQFVILAGQADDAFDFDSGTKQVAGADATAGAIGITAANGAKFAVLLTNDTPSLAACTAVPESRWVSQVVVGSLVPGAKVCVRTSENRYAWFITRTGELVTGALYTSNLDYIVYKKTGD